MVNKEENRALSIFFMFSLVLHISLLLLIPLNKMEAIFSGTGNNYKQIRTIAIRITGSGEPLNKGQEKTELASQKEENPKGNVEDHPASKVEIKPTETTKDNVPKKPGESSKSPTPEPKAVRSDTPEKKPEPLQEKASKVEVVTSKTSGLEVDFEAISTDAQGRVIDDEGKGGSITNKTGTPEGNADHFVPPKGEDYITNQGGSGGFTTKNIQSLEFTGVLEMIFEVDSEGKLTVVLVKGLGDERFNKDLVNFAQRSWRGRFDQEAKTRFPDGYQVPVTVVFDKGNGTHTFGDVKPLK